MTTNGRLRTQGIMMLAVTLIVGVLLGVAVERVRIVREANRPRPFEGFRPNRDPLPSFFEELGLTGEQRTQLTEIFESRRLLERKLELVGVHEMEDDHVVPAGPERAERG